MVRKNKRKPGETRGQKAFQPTQEQRDQVKTMAGLAMTHKQIALVLKIDRDTLAKYFHEELSTAMIMANMAVTRNLFHRTKDDTKAAQFWLINRNKEMWTNTQRIDTTMRVTDERPELYGLSSKELEQVRKLATMLKSAQARLIDQKPEPRGDNND